jgi:hypothetical protein
VDSRLDAEKAFDLLNRLNSTVRDAVSREEKIERDYRGKVAGERRHREIAIEEHSSRLAGGIAQAEQVYQNEKAIFDSKYAVRKARIAKAYKASRRQRLKTIDDQQGGRKYRIQKMMMQLDRDRETGLANAEKAFEDFKIQAAQEQEALAMLEERARRSFGGFRKIRRLLFAPGTVSPPDPAADENHLIQELRALLGQVNDELGRYRRLPVPLLFRCLPVWLLAAAAVAGGVWLILAPPHVGANPISQPVAVGGTLVLLAVILGLHFLGGRQAEPPAKRISGELEKCRQLHGSCLEKADARHRGDMERVEAEYKRQIDEINRDWTQVAEDAVEMQNALPRMIDNKEARVTEKNELRYRAAIERIERARAECVEHLQKTTDEAKREAAGVHEERITRLETDYAEQWRALEADWKERAVPLYEAVGAVNAAAAKFPDWQASYCANWSAPQEFAHMARFGRAEVEVEKLAGALPKDPRLALPGPARFDLPLLLAYPQRGSILFESTRWGRDAAIGALNDIILRLLSVSPPGRLSFTIVDPVGLGQSFAGIMHLADYEESLINNRIWTQSSQIEQRLADLSEHMEKVIQMYLRNEYATIAEYNEQAGNIAEKYHFLVVADFPVNFSEIAAKRLLNIAASGARCGVYTLIHWDRRQTHPQDFIPEELRKSSVCIGCREDGYALAGQVLDGAKLALDSPPSPELATDFIQKVGQASKDSNRVEVPFSHVTPADAELWTGETTNELRIPIGRTGATKFQCLAIGRDTRQHALIAGKTGSGKSTLFHVIITNLSLWCSPEQVEFYLVDFKKGVEFKCYAVKRLPHARVVAIESDREFGLSVLQRVDDELRRRGDLFRKLGVQDVAGYKRAGGTEPMPRSLLIVDEFQEFFVEDDKISQGASVLLDRIVRQGRAFGIHVLLGSQTLGGAYTLARTTLGQMVIRVALQCNEADALLIMDDNNPAPRLLSRPGEGIYNDMAGAMEGNSPFQTVWLPEAVRDGCLDRVRALADRKPSAYPGPIVFEGNAPADVKDNLVLKGLLEAEAVKPPAPPRIWLGAPNSIKGPTEAVFHRQSGNNLLIVGQSDEAILAMLSVALVSLAAQFPPGKLRAIVLDGNPPDTPPRRFLERIIGAIPRGVTLAKNNDVPEIMKGLADEVRAGADGEPSPGTPSTFLFIQGLQKYRKLRYEEEFSFSSDNPETAANPAVQLNHLLAEGARLGFHVIATCDNFNNVNRFLGRKALGEFEMRVLFQMSANDSACLIDSPKASALGLHRALFYNEQEGYLETFRPYALPGGEWIEQVNRNLSRLLK